MSIEQWTAVDDYINERVVRPDAVLDAALRATADAGMPAIAVSAAQGKLLHLLAQSIGAQRILEIGTLGGYSTIWMARALPAGGRLISLELDERHAEVARANVARAGLEEIVDIVVGPALETLPKLANDGAGPFDLSFIDADKANIPSYFNWALDLSRRGGLIIVDNVVRNGGLIHSASSDANVAGVRELHELLASHVGVSATTIQTVGSKGYDGFTLAVVL